MFYSAKKVIIDVLHCNVNTKEHIAWNLQKNLGSNELIVYLQCTCELLCFIWVCMCEAKSFGVNVMVIINVEYVNFIVLQLKSNWEIYFEVLESNF